MHSTPNSLARHPKSDIVSVALAAVLLGVSEKAVRHLCRQGYLSILRGYRPARIPLSQLEKLADTIFTDGDVVEAVRTLAANRPWRRPPPTVPEHEFNVLLRGKAPLYDSPFSTRFHPARSAPHDRA